MEKRNLIKSVRWQDILVVLGFIVYIGAGFCTNFILTEVGALTEYANNLEANPEARAVLDWNFNLMHFQWVVIAMIGGMYYMIRRATLLQIKQRPDLIMVLSFFSIFIFLYFFQNLMNDFGYMLKLWLTAVVGV